MSGPNINLLNTECKRMITEASDSIRGFDKLGDQELSARQMNKEMKFLHERTRMLAQIMWEITEILKKNNIQ